MWVISDAKRLECRAHMCAYDGCMASAYADSASICTRSPSYRIRSTVDPRELGMHEYGRFARDAKGMRLVGS